jgi:hypothetical protein
VGTGPKQARVALQKMRAEQYLNVIRQLCQIRVITFPKDLVEGLGPKLKAAGHKRDLLAHGLWIRDPKTGALHIWQILGAWASGPLQGISRRLKPEAVSVTPDYFKTAIREIDAIVLQLRQLARRLEQLVKATP